MKENFLQKGDIVRCKDWDGATGEELLTYGQNALFKVIKTEVIKRVSAHEWLAYVVPINTKGPEICAHWSRFTKDKSFRPTLPEPDMSLDEIHQAQEMIDGEA